MGLKPRKHPVDQRRIEKGPRGVVDQNAVGSASGKRLKPGTDGLLPRRAALNRRPQTPGERPGRGFVTDGVVGVDDDEDVADRGMDGKGVDGVRDHGHAADRPILLRQAAAAIATKTMFVHCGNWSVAPVPNPPYCAQ